MSAHDIFDFLASDKVAATRAAICARVLEAALSGDLVIVGSGRLPRKCLTAIRAVGGSCPFFVEFDPRFWGQEALGIPIIGPDQAIERTSPKALYVCGV